MKYALFIIILFVITLPSVGVTQTYNPLQTGDVKQQVTLDVSSQYPKANEIVNLSVSAFGTNLSAANVSWSVNGKVIQSGVGATKFSVNSGNYGQTKKVSVVIQSKGLPTINKTTIIAPQEVSIIYEADSYTPPFYKGKGLFNKEGTVKFVAMPNMTSSTGARLNSSSLIYKWIINDTVQGSVSGYGKNFFQHTSSLLGEVVKVEVEVSSVDGKTKGKSMMITAPDASEILMYEKNPLYGILYNRDVGSNSFTLKDSEVTIKAEPFFLSTSPTKAGLQYTWSINGSIIPVPLGQDYVTLRNSTGQQGTSLIGVIVNNSTHLLQKISSSFPINF